MSYAGPFDRSPKNTKPSSGADDTARILDALGIDADTADRMLALGRRGFRPGVDLTKAFQPRDARSLSDSQKIMAGYGMTTAQMIYRMPDHQNVLNVFIWQDYDLAPDYPVLLGFIAFWRKNIEGALHRVLFNHARTTRGGEWHQQVGEFPV